MPFRTLRIPLSKFRKSMLCARKIYSLPMPKNLYPPLNDSDLVVWLQNFANKIGLYAAKYTITDSEIAQLQQATSCFTYWVAACHQAKVSVTQVSCFKNEIRDGIRPGGAPNLKPKGFDFDNSPPQVNPGILLLFKTIATRIKQNTCYLPTDGEDLRIDGEERKDSYYSLKPYFKVDFYNNCPQLTWPKAGCDAVKIIVFRFNHGQLPAKAISNDLFEFLAIDTQSGYIDRHPLPAPGERAVWAYVMIYMIGDDEVGKWSDVVFVDVAGREIEEGLGLNG